MTASECAVRMIEEYQQIVAANERTINAQEKIIACYEKMFKTIAKLGGNLPDDRLTDRTGPNDAAHRGLMYVGARDLALKTLGKTLDQLWSE